MSHNPKTYEKRPFFNPKEVGWGLLRSIFCPTPNNGKTLENRPRNIEVRTIFPLKSKVSKTSKFEAVKPKKVAEGHLPFELEAWKCHQWTLHTQKPLF